MSKRYLAGLLALALLCTAAAGCGRKKSDSSMATGSSAAETSAVTNAEGETAAEDVFTETAVVTDAEGQPATDAAGETQVETVIFTGGSAEDDQEGEYGTQPAAATKPDQPANTQTGASTGGAENASLHITVETAEVTLDDLKAKDYTIPLVITLDKNPGINYSEWGLKLDERCTYKAEKKGMDFETVSYINDSKHFLWTAWTSGAETISDSGSLLTLYVTVPTDAQPGTTYSIEYADWSLADAAHIWQGGSDNWVKTNQVGWTNGGVVVK